MNKILAPIEYYLPSYKAGGPVNSLSNIVDRFSNDFEFKIITKDRDLGDSTCFKNILIDEWLSNPKVMLYYVSPDKLKLFSFFSIIKKTEFDILYLNSFFSFFFSIYFVLLLKFKIIKTKKIVIAPRGEFSNAALSIKFFRKKAYLLLSKILGLYDDSFVWQASSSFEETDLRSALGKKVKIVVAPDLPPLKIYDQNNSCITNKKNKNELRLVFLSRISKIKNLDGALRVLSKTELKGDVVFDIYGPIEDKEYWAECQSLIEKINDEKRNVYINYLGPVAKQDISKTLSKYHLFFLPTKGESFGYAILESFSSACPVLISNRTPWRNLKEKGLGWDLELNDLKAFGDVINNVLSMDEKAYRPWSIKSEEFAMELSKNRELVEMSRKLFL